MLVLILRVCYRCKGLRREWPIMVDGSTIKHRVSSLSSVPGLLAHLATQLQAVKNRVNADQTFGAKLTDEECRRILKDVECTMEEFANN